MSERKEETIQNEETQEDENLQSENPNIQNVETQDEGLQSDENVNIQIVETQDEGLQSKDANVQNLETQDEGLQNKDANVQNLETQDEGLQSKNANIQDVQVGKKTLWNFLTTPTRPKIPLIVAIMIPIISFVFFVMLILMYHYLGELNYSIQEKREITIKALQEVNRLKQALYYSAKNLSRMEMENSQVRQQLNSTLEEKAELQQTLIQLNYSIQEKREITIKALQEVNRLKQALYYSAKNLSRMEMENSQVRQQLNSTLEEQAELQQTLIQLKDRNRKMLTILSSNKLSFIWSVCNKDSLQCLRCPPGWTEHSLRCFMIPTTAKKWEEARRECLNNNGDLAIVLNSKDQAFLTNFTIQFVRKNPQMDVLSTWIGLQDMVQEGTFIWVNGEKVKPSLSYWRDLEPNNAISSWDPDSSGQDCVAIVPPKSTSVSKWLNSWDDIICGGKRHFICEVQALV